MGRITLVELAAGATASSTDANTTLTNWNTQSADVDADNIREEGLDRRSITARAVSPFTATQHDWRTLVSAADGDAYGPADPGAAFIEVVVGANNLRIGPMDYDQTNGDQLLVRFSAEYIISIASIIQSGGRYDVRLAYSTNATAWTTIAGTTRSMRQMVSYVPDGDGISGDVGIIDTGSITIAHRFNVVGLATSTLYLRVEHQHVAPASNVTLRYPNFFARSFAR